MQQDSRLVIVGISIGIVCASLAMLVPMITPSEDAVKIRNSLIYDVVDIDDLKWVPPDYPPSFALETMEPPKEFLETINQLDLSNDSVVSEFTRAIAIARLLGAMKIEGGAIQADSVSSLNIILSEGRGYCADYTQVFNGLAHSSDIPVREWGMSFDGIAGAGHAFNEIFDRSMNRWVFIDSFFSFYVVDKLTGRPLSALEFREKLMDQPGFPDIEIVAISEERFGFPSALEAVEYYRRGASEIFLWWGNNVFEYDNSIPVGLAAGVSRSFEQAVAILVGVHPRIRIPRLAENENQIASFSMLKVKFLLLASISSLFFVVALWHSVVFLRERR